MAKRVLIVEDNELNLKLFRDLLETHGFDVVDTRDGIEAFDLARKYTINNLINTGTLKLTFQ